MTLLPYTVPVLEERLIGGGPGWGPAQLQASAEAAAAGIAPAALPKVGPQSEEVVYSSACCDGCNHAAVVLLHAFGTRVVR
jgi:hypothetical protein